MWFWLWAVQQSHRHPDSFFLLCPDVAGNKTPGKRLRSVPCLGVQVWHAALTERKSVICITISTPAETAASSGMCVRMKTHDSFSAFLSNIEHETYFCFPLTWTCVGLRLRLASHAFLCVSLSRLSIQLGVAVNEGAFSANHPRTNLEKKKKVLYPGSRVSLLHSLMLKSNTSSPNKPLACKTVPELQTLTLDAMGAISLCSVRVSWLPWRQVQIRHDECRLFAMWQTHSLTAG